jgi:hypothetical protein
MLMVLPEHDVHVTVTDPVDVPTLTVAVPLTAPLLLVLVAVIVTVVVLIETALIKPVLFTLTILLSELAQVVPDEAVRFLVLPSL